MAGAPHPGLYRLWSPAFGDKRVVVRPLGLCDIAGRCHVVGPRFHTAPVLVLRLWEGGRPARSGRCLGMLAMPRPVAGRQCVDGESCVLALEAPTAVCGGGSQQLVAADAGACL